MVTTSLFINCMFNTIYIGEKILFYSMCYFTVHPDVLFMAILQCCGVMFSLILIGSLLDFLSRLPSTALFCPIK